MKSWNRWCGNTDDNDLPPPRSVENVIKYLEDAFAEFRSCFQRVEAYHWFVMLTLGFMIRDDTLGVTSVIRALALPPSCYEPMLHFFYSKAWSLPGIRQCWYGIVRDSGLILKVDGRLVLAGDGVKQSKEAFYMPGVKKLHQESEDSSKGSYIFGHLFGAVGAVITTATDTFCLPLMMSIQEGLAEAADWENSTISAESHVLQMIRNGFDIAAAMGPSILLLDRYFLTRPAIRLLDELNLKQGRKLDLVTKAKRNAAGYEKPPAKLPGQKGRPRKKGDAVGLWNLFEQTSLFQEADVHVYGKQAKAQFLCRDLLWGPGLYRELRFVLVVLDGVKSILVSSDTGLTPVQIIELYARRFRIENCFREFKQQIGGFAYHFWTKSIGRLNHFKKKEEPNQIGLVTDGKKRDRVLLKVRAIECFVQLCCIAMGLIQLLSFREQNNKNLLSIRYLRTVRRKTASEATVRYYLYQRLFPLLALCPDTPIMQIIQKARHPRKQREPVA